MINSLTSLRGIFILFIFFHHCLDLYDGGGTMAVAFFFVLGGFAMTLGYEKRVRCGELCYKDYIVRRCVKFYPLHWLCLLAVLPFALWSFNWKLIPVFLINAVLLQTWIPIRGIYFSYNSVSWYLANTIFFAALFPFVFRWISRASPKGKGIIAVFMGIVYILVASLIPEDKYHAVLYISPYMRLMDFVLGIYLAIGYLKIKEITLIKRNITLCQVITGSLIAILVVESCLLPDDARLFAPVYWIPISALILIASLTEKKWGGQILLCHKYLQKLGELSFIIFMIHQIILRYTTIIFEKILHFENDIIYIVFTLAMTLIASVIIDKRFLKPIAQWLTKRNQRSMIAHS